MRPSNKLDWLELALECLTIRLAANIIQDRCENPNRPSVCDTGEIELPLSVRVRTLADKLFASMGGTK